MDSACLPVGGSFIGIKRAWGPAHSGGRNRSSVRGQSRPGTASGAVTNCVTLRLWGNNSRQFQAPYGQATYYMGKTLAPRGLGRVQIFGWHELCYKSMVTDGLAAKGGVAPQRKVRGFRVGYCRRNIIGGLLCVVTRDLR